VIEGLRLLPWWHEAIKRDLIGARSKCETCMDRTPSDERQIQGCGYLPPLDESLRSVARIPSVLGSNVDPTVCPGYSTRLPEVIEVARARLHWSKGSLREFVGGNPTDALVMGIEFLEGANNECEGWAMRKENREKGGG
jgi:hypothetical protein